MSKTEKEYELLKSVEQCCRDVIINIAIHSELGKVESRSDKVEDDILYNSFLAQTRNNALFIALLRWCQIFGANKESTHWKNISGLCHKSVRAKICNECVITEREWENYHEVALSFRDKIIAHVDIGEVLSNPSKYTKIYLNSTFILRALVITLMEELNIDDQKLQNEIELISTLTNEILLSQAFRMAENRIF
ncbi:hypothetical protein GNP78_19095 [Aliivibrio fischeri]|nr:hypothetical protein [Aliivibrio fischeri]